MNKFTEAELIEDWQKRQDPKALEIIFDRHNRLVAKIAQGYRGYGLPISDLIAEGNIGMMQALKNFDLSRGIKFSTYAVFWIRAAMNEYIINAYSLVRLAKTPAQRKLFFKLNQAREKLSDYSGAPMTRELAQKIANELNVPLKDVLIMDKRMKKDLSLNVPVGSSEDAQNAVWQDFIEDKKHSPEETAIKQNKLDFHKHLIEDSFTVLTQREQEIIKRRRLKEPPESLETVSHVFGVSRERIRQIENNALDKIKHKIHQKMLDKGMTRLF